jgi:undecaprenyl-diphosphatase
MNYSLFKAINGLTGNGLVDTTMEDVAKYLISVSFAVLGVLAVQRLRARSLRPVVTAGAALAVTFLIGLAGAAAFAERRPFQTHHVHQLIAHAGGQSFPSDHATAAFGIALAVLMFLSRRWGLVLLVLAGLIGFARVYDGLHYPGDIAGGLLAAAIGVALAAAADRQLGDQPPTRRRTAAPAPAPRSR